MFCFLADPLGNKITDQQTSVIEMDDHLRNLTNFKKRDIGMYIATAIVYVIHLAVDLIWRFGKSCKYCQIKCSPFRL